MSLEEDFFAAQDAQARADRFAEFDPATQPAHTERRIFLFIGVGLAVALGVIYLLMPGTDAAPDPTTPSSAAALTPASTAPASTAPASTAPASTAPASTAPASTAKAPTAPARTSRLARLLKANASAAGAAPSPPVAAPAEFGAARQQIEAGAFDQALATLGAADGFEAQALRGWALYELGRDADARRALRAALAIRPDHAESLLLLGSLEQSRDNTAAKQTYEAFLAAHPNAPQAGEVRQILDRI